jgi:peptidyl-prolyl cis-trans isomerase B (cyclophilin B)
VTRRLLGRLGLAVLVPLLALATACGSGNGDKPNATKSSAAGRCSYQDDGSKPAKQVDPPPSNPPASNPTTLTISTSAGDIPLTLEPDQAPCAVNSLVSLASQGYFDDTQCHRLTTQGYYVLQCGDPTGTGSGGPGYTFADELVDNDPRLQPCGEEQGQKYCTYSAGTVAMANSGMDTNGSQFFLVYGNSKFPPSYTVLGHMDAAGLKVVTAIGKLGIGTPNGMGPGDGTPKEPVTITSMK